MEVGGKVLQQSRCVQLDVGDSSDAVAVFSAKSESGEIPLVLIPKHRSWIRPSGYWMTVPTGCYCLLQKFGESCGVALPGGSIKPPYYRIAYIVNMQSCTYNAPIKNCPTQDNVRVNVDVVIVFTIREPEEFVFKLGAVRFNELLAGAVDEGVRILVRAQSHRTIRELRGNRADSLLHMLNQKFSNMGVVFMNCTITNVVLPTSLFESLEHTTEMKKSMEKAKREHVFELGELSRKSEIELEELKRKNEQTIVAEQGRRKRAELEYEQRLVKAKEELEIATIETEQKMSVKKMEAVAALERKKVDMEKYRIQKISEAEAEAERKRVAANIYYETETVNAEGDKQKMLGDAQAIAMDAGAEAEASKHLQHKRRHELEMREKDVLMKLALKGKFNLIGEPGDKIVNAVMTGNIEGGVSSSDGQSWFK